MKNNSLDTITLSNGHQDCFSRLIIGQSITKSITDMHGETRKDIRYMEYDTIRYYTSKKYEPRNYEPRKNAQRNYKQNEIDIANSSCS